jgi:hypothetical protein
VNETDTMLLPEGLNTLKRVARLTDLNIDGSHLNLDGGFDSRHNRKAIFNAGLIPNIKENPRNRKTPKARAQAFVRCRHPFVTALCGADLRLGGQIQTASVALQQFSL